MHLRFVLLLLGLLQLPWLHAGPLLISGDDNYPPIIYQENQRPAGALPALLNALGKQTGLQFQLQLFPWKRAYETAVSGKSGLIGVSRNAEREKQFDFSDPLYFDDINLIAIKSRSFPFNGFDDLGGLRIGAQNGASFGEEADKELLAHKISLERDDSATSRLKKLLAGRLDLAVVGNGRAGLEGLLDNDPGLASNRDQFVILPKPLNHDPLYLAFPKSMKMQAVLARINKAMAEINKQKKVRGRE